MNFKIGSLVRFRLPGELFRVGQITTVTKDGGAIVVQPASGQPLYVTTDRVVIDG